MADNGFDLGAMLAELTDVSDLGTGREQIDYISLDLIDNDPNNFYQLTQLEGLADNIATCGLQQPIRVRKSPDSEGRYVIVSGHRRRAAIEILREEDPEKWTEIPCIVQRDDVSPPLQQLRLIYANAHTRVLTSAEIGEQAVQVEKLLYELKEQGYEFPGRMRDHVAKAVGASKSKLARLKVIREQLIPNWYILFQQGKINESTAYELAQLPQVAQRAMLNVYGEKTSNLWADRVRTFGGRYRELEKIECHSTDSCISNMGRLEKLADPYVFGCSCCCADCSDLAKCKVSCVSCAHEKDQAKVNARNQKYREEQQRIAKDKPAIDYISGVYRRVGEARKLAGKRVTDLYRASGRIYVGADEGKQIDMEKGKVKFSVNTSLPFGYGFSAENANRLVSVAELLGCSIDWLLGRDVPGPGEVPESGPTQKYEPWAIGEHEIPYEPWAIGEHEIPTEPGKYVVLCKWSRSGNLGAHIYYWDGQQWLDSRSKGNDLLSAGCIICYWMPIPEGE